MSEWEQLIDEDEGDRTQPEGEEEPGQEERGVEQDVNKDKGEGVGPRVRLKCNVIDHLRHS